MSFKITRYHHNMQSHWDDVIARSDKGTFMHRRAYMEYHATRFEDFSLLVYKDQIPVAVLPAHRQGLHIIAHNGLTYSDFIFDKKLRIAHQIDIMSASMAFMLDNDLNSFRIKSIPVFFHNQPNESTLYLYHKMKGISVEIKPFFVLHTHNFILNKDRKKNLKRLKKLNLTIKDDAHYIEAYWQIVTQNLKETYQSKPVHSLDEIQLLMQRFPEQIKLFTIFDRSQLLGGALVYIINNVVHFQYINAHPHHDKSAIDLLIFDIIERYKNEYTHISFGSSATGDQNLNAGLSYWKESFGCKILNQYIYDVKLDNYKLLNTTLQ